jgi:predicted CoA-binding protein
MKSGKIITLDSDIREILQNSKTIAVLGLSPKPERDSYQVAAYLQQNGYEIIPVRPAQRMILGEKAYASLTEIHRPVDIVNVFRNSDQVLAHAREALELKPNVFWMQLDIQNHDAALMLTARGIDVIMNRCIQVEHERLVRKTTL